MRAVLLAAWLWLAAGAAMAEEKPCEVKDLDLMKAYGAHLALFPKPDRQIEQALLVLMLNNKCSFNQRLSALILYRRATQEMMENVEGQSVSQIVADILKRMEKAKRALQGPPLAK